MIIQLTRMFKIVDYNSILKVRKRRKITSQQLILGNHIIHLDKSTFFLNLKDFKKVINDYNYHLINMFKKMFDKNYNIIKNIQKAKKS